MLLLFRTIVSVRHKSSVSQGIIFDSSEAANQKHVHVLGEHEHELSSDSLFNVHSLDFVPIDVFIIYSHLSDLELWFGSINSFVPKSDLIL